MNLRTPRRSGYALVLAIVAIFFSGVIVLVAASGTQTMQFEADRLQRKLINDNLQHSGHNWLRQNATMSIPSNSPRQLDTRTLTKRPSTLTLTAAADLSSIQIQTAYTLGRQTVQDSYTALAIPARPPPAP